MKILEEKTVTVIKTAEIGVKCDYCHKESSSDFGWHHFSTMHYGWGNDSIESLKVYDACSPECYINLIGIALIDLKEYKKLAAKIDDMTYDFAEALYGRFGNVEK